MRIPLWINTGINAMEMLHLKTLEDQRLWLKPCEKNNKNKDARFKSWSDLFGFFLVIYKNTTRRNGFLD